ncbi:MerR family transcriptional regulator [Streptomyces sp. NPDC001770]
MCARRGAAQGGALTGHRGALAGQGGALAGQGGALAGQGGALARPLRRVRRATGEYVDEDGAVVRRIRSLLAAGLNTSTIRTVLPCLRDEGEGLVPICSDLVAGLHRERDRIARAITDLRASMAALDGVIAAAPADVTRRALSSLGA